MCVHVCANEWFGYPETLNYSYPGWYYSWRRQGCAAESQSDSFDKENMVCAVWVLLIHHSKQEIVFLHPDKSSSRHLPHTGLVLCVCTRKTGTHIYSQFMLSASITGQLVVYYVIPWNLWGCICERTEIIAALQSEEIHVVIDSA